jgi:glycosyltransferase involved in cell wall biosynthesis
LRRPILIISQHPYPFHTAMARNIAHLLSAGVDVDLISQIDAGGYTPAPGLRLFRVAGRHRRASAFWYVYEYVTFLAAAFALSARLSIANRYRTVQVDNMPDFLVLAALPPRLRGARLVLNMFELGPEMTAARLSISEDHPAVRAMLLFEKVATRWSDRVITVSEPCRRILARRGLDPGKATVLPNTVDLGGHHRDAAAAIATPYLITHATLIERYGVQIAIRAMRELERDWPELTLRVVGDGEYRPHLEALTSELGLERKVRFVGKLTWDQTMEHVSRAAIGLVPIVPDGYGQLLFPTKLMEYIEMGVPAVASRLATVREYFDDDAIAYFDACDHVGLAARVDGLLRDPAAARRQADRAHDSLAGLRWPVVAPRYMAALGLVEPAT